MQLDNLHQHMDLKKRSVVHLCLTLLPTRNLFHPASAERIVLIRSTLCFHAALLLTQSRSLERSSERGNLGLSRNRIW
jgi:hypothetical protein